MIQYENDERAVQRVLDSLGEGEVIDHATARTIAAGYNDHRTADFVSTGRMEIDAEFLMDAVRRGADAETLRRDAKALSALEAYLREREEVSDIEPVPGWSDMWVPKHVNRPHRDGALPECWCFDEDDDAYGTDQCEGCGWETRNCACDEEC